MGTKIGQMGLGGRKGKRIRRWSRVEQDRFIGVVEDLARPEKVCSMYMRVINQVQIFLLFNLSDLSTNPHGLRCMTFHERSRES